MLLPQKFWREDAYGCRGGVELGIMSTTTTRGIAVQYSGAEKGRPTIFEIEVGQVDRGAPLRWVSQYPGEDEIVMPPLSNLEVVGEARVSLMPGTDDVSLMPVTFVSLMPDAAAVQPRGGGRRS